MEGLADRPLAPTLTEAAAEGYDVADCRFTGVLEHADLYRLDAARCRFDGCRLTGCDFTRASLQEVIFDHCDLSGARFDDAGLLQVQFLDCRGLGAYFTGALWDEVTIEGGSFQYANLARVEWKNCRLRTGMQDAVLTDLTAKKTHVDGCDFTRADWSHAHIAQLDLSRSVIEGAVFSPEALQGVRVSRDQAADLARLLGLVIQA